MKDDRTSLDFEADEDLWLGRGPQSPNSINTFRDGAFRSEYSAYRIDFTNISRVVGAASALIAEGVYGVEFQKQLRSRAARQASFKNVLEVLLNPDNRITLASEKDAMGIPKPAAHYAIDAYTRQGAEVSKKDFARIAELMGGTNLRYSQEGFFANNQHICETLSMGKDPTTSVTDDFGRAHDHENLYMVGTGIMPTCGTCNSTQTAIALALRTAHHLLPMKEPLDPMAEAVDHSLRHLTDEDLNAMAIYLKTVPPVPSKNVGKAAHTFGGLSHELHTIRDVALPANQEQWTGAQLYDAHCATCHLAQGQGSRGLPSLFHNTALGWDNTNNLVLVTLQDIERQNQGETMEVVMPAFADTLSDYQIATLSTYVLDHFGNSEAKVTLNQVERLRAGEAAGSDLVKIARVAIAVGVLLTLAMLAAIIVWWRRRRHPLNTG